MHCSTRNMFRTLLIFFSNCCLILADWNTNDYVKKEHSLQKPYTDGKWDFIGSTILSNNFVRLTPDHQSKRGAIWNRSPVSLKDWEMHVHFKVHGSGKDLFGDGFALWYAKDRLKLGEVFGSVDKFKGLAIFLDTYSNHNGPHNHGHPYISAMVNNGSMSYDHDRDGTHTEMAGCESQFRNSNDESYVAIRYENSVLTHEHPYISAMISNGMTRYDHDADGTHTELAGCHAKFRNQYSQTFVAIRYQQNNLTVSTDIEGKNSWKECFSVQGVRLPTGYYFGASAATGDLADNHDIVSIKVYDIQNEDRQKDNTDYSKVEPEADFFAPPRDHIEDDKGGFMLSKITGWKLLVIIILIIVGLGICGMVAFIIISKKQEESRKRFY